MTLVPAVMALLGDRAWKLPRRLGRIVSNVDIEGEQLMHGLRPSAGAR
jgi:RND superfamily putative drug exporter